MSSVSALSSTAATQDSFAGEAFAGLEVGDFLNMLITELRNQDPLDPADSSEILNQITQIKEIHASEALTTTLHSLFMGQSLATAASMMGKWVVQLDDDNTVLAAGEIECVWIEDGKPRFQVGDDVLGLQEVSQVYNETEGQVLRAALEAVGSTVRGSTDPTPLVPVPQEIEGVIDRISLVNGSIKIHVGNHTIDIANVTALVSDGDGTTDNTDTIESADDGTDGAEETLSPEDDA